jgi:hypothetical protein
MARVYSGQRSAFSGLLLILVGVLLLVHNYHGLPLSRIFLHWWPLLLILWGVVKFYERSGGRASGGWITGGEVGLVILLVAVVGSLAAYDYGRGYYRDKLISLGGDRYSFDLDVAPQPVPANARISVRNYRGDVTVRASDTPNLRVNGTKFVRGWSDNDAQRIAEPVTAQVIRRGDSWVVQPSGYDSSDSRYGMNLEVVVPKKATVTVRSDKGDIQISDCGADVSADNGDGDIEINDTAGNINIDSKRGDITVSDTKGDVKISGHGGQVAVTNASGGLTLDGEFFGPIRAERIAKGVRFLSQRTDMTLTQLGGHLEIGEGNLEIADAPKGDLALRTKSFDINLENIGGAIAVENRSGDITLRFSAPPRNDITIANSSGGISLSMPGEGSFHITADCKSCDIGTDFSGGTLVQQNNSGNAHLEGQYGSGRGPRITLKTSYKSITLNKTT